MIWSRARVMEVGTCLLEYGKGEISGGNLWLISVKVVELSDRRLGSEE